VIIVPNISATPQPLNTTDQTVYGTDSSFPGAIGGHPKIILALKYSIRILSAGGGEVIFTGQRKIGIGGTWEELEGDASTASYTLPPGDDNRWDFNFTDPYITGIDANTTLFHRLRAKVASPADDVILHVSVASPQDSIPYASVWWEYFYQN